MLFGETGAVYYEKPTNTLWGQNAVYINSVRTSQETHYISATKPNRLMLFGVKGRCLLWEPYETHKYTVWVECRVLVH
jgi:hypothetical protein